MSLKNLEKKVIELAKIVKIQNQMIDAIQESNTNQYDVSELETKLNLLIWDIDNEVNDE